MNITYHIVGTSAEFLELLVANPYEDLSALAKAVKSDSPPVTKETIGDFFSYGGAIAVAIFDSDIVGAACLVKVHKYNGFSYRLEHVSVLPEFQNKGVARGLIVGLHRVAALRDGRHIDLACEPHRIAANRLYESLGYEVRETNTRRRPL